MTAIEKLKSCATLTDLAILLGIKAASLSYILYKVPDSDKYYEFTIPKRSGGTRTIHAPVPALKSVQRRLANYLSLCLEEISQKREIEKQCVVSHGFRKGFSIVTNARRHRNRRYVFNVDLREFFPSIHFGRVRGYFNSNADFLLNIKISTIIAQIACRNGTLPQGSPCSPIISNLIGNILDVHLSKLASGALCTYTRYADDLSFSTNLGAFPSSIAVPSTVSLDTWEIAPELRSRIGRAGFLVNEAKTRMSIRNSRQQVTGLVVNKVVNVPNEYYKTTRAMCDRLFRTGAFDYEYGSRVPAPERVLEPLKGRLSYIFNVKHPIPEDKPRERERILGWPKDVPGIYRLYRQFLDYKYFYGISRPTILAEGPTDGIYLRAAIRSLYASFPSLALRVEGGIRLIPHLYKYNQTSHAVHELSGGFGDFSALIARYKTSLSAFTAPKPTAPVIILIDNDSGAKPIYSTIKTVTKSSSVIDGKLQFYHIHGNLYVVPLPLQGKVEVDIESFLSPIAVNAILAGKKLFKGTGGFDPSVHVTKAALADRIVKQPPGAVDFTGFAPILEAIVAVQDDYGKRGWI